MPRYPVTDLLRPATRRRPVHLIAPVLVLVASAGCGSTDSSTTGNLGGTTTATSTAAAPPGSAPGSGAGGFPVTPGPPAAGPRSGADLAFVEHLIQHHRQALELCRLARQHSQDPALLQLADRISADQTRELATLTGWLTGWKQPVPEGLGGHLGAHSDEVTDGSLSENDWKELHATPAAEIEVAVLRYLQMHNTGTVIFAGQYLSDTLHPAANPEVKALAAAMATNRKQRNQELRPVLRRLVARS